MSQLSSPDPTDGTYVHAISQMRHEEGKVGAARTRSELEMTLELEGRLGLGWGAAQSQPYQGLGSREDTPTAGALMKQCRICA